MEKSSKIYVAGHRGLVGSAFMRTLASQGYSNIVTRTHAELDLCDQRAVGWFFEEERPEYVILSAAKVGGIHANNTYPAEFIYNNLMIESNIIHNAWKSGVQKLLFLGSSCIYPKFAPQPMPESCLLEGALEPTNEPYAIAKIAGIKLCQSYNRQYGTKFISVMPTNLFGLKDNYHPQNAHVLPALIRRFHEAKMADAHEVVVWGSGTPMREFLYGDDLAEACLFLMHSYDGSDIVNIGTGMEVSIRELAETVKAVVGFDGALVFDPTKPDGTPRKLLDCSRIHGLGWKHRVGLAEGIGRAYRDFLENDYSER